MKKGKDRELERTGYNEDWNKDSQGLIQGKAKQLGGEKANTKSLKKMEEEWEKLEWIKERRYL